MHQFTKFCFVGSLGFIVDSLSFILFTQIFHEIMLVRVLAFWFAAMVTWLGNKFFTFEGNRLEQNFMQNLAQWSKYMFIAHLSGVFNILVFWTTKEIFSIPVAFILGIFTGLFCNYLMSIRFVFIKST